MSISRHYAALNNAEDAQSALPYVFLATGDSVFTAEKRVGECFFTRGRGRKMDDSDLFSYVQSTEDMDDYEDTKIESDITTERVKVINSYLESKINAINEEYTSENRVTKNVRGSIIDLKSVYAYMLSKIESPNDLKDFASPDIKSDPWALEWSLNHLELDPLYNFSLDEVRPSDKGETALFKAIKDKISYDRFKILDDLIEYFKSTDREDLVEYIKVNTFKFISDSTSGIANSHDLSEEDFSVVNSARVMYISRRKIDLNYSLELVNLPATTYKKRSGKIKSDLLELGEELSSGVNNKMKDYLIS